MSDNSYYLPFDPTGQKASNRITGEKQVLTPPPWRDFHFIIPIMAPYFSDSFKMYDVDTGDELVEGEHFAFTHRFYGASKAIMKPVYGSILFFDKTLTGAVEMEYQSIGGEWTIDGTQISKILAQKQYNPRITTWEQVAAVPLQFPVIDHDWHLTDMVGMSDVKNSIDNLSISVEDALNRRINHLFSNVDNLGELIEEHSGDLITNLETMDERLTDNKQKTESDIAALRREFRGTIQLLTASFQTQLDNRYTKAESDALRESLRYTLLDKFNDTYNRQAIDGMMDLLHSQLAERYTKNEVTTIVDDLERRLDEIQTTLSDNNIT